MSWTTFAPEIPEASCDPWPAAAVEAEAAALNAAAVCAEPEVVVGAESLIGVLM